MIAPLFESMGKITGATVEMQQEMFKKWLGTWTGMPGMPSMSAMPGSPGAWGEFLQKIQKKWAEAVNDLTRRHRETLELQFRTGMQNIEKAFQLTEAKSPEELRTKTVELWQKCFETAKQTSEAQLRDMQAAIQKWVELMTPTLPS